MTTMITLDAYATMHSVVPRTVLRWLAAGLVPGAVKVGKAWSIPSDAPPPTPGMSRDITVSPTGHRDLTPDMSPDMTGVRVVPPRTLPPGLWPIAMVAEFYGTSVGGIKRMGRDGKLDVGKWGYGGAWAVFKD